MGGDLLALLAAVALLAANAFFVGAEFALISARATAWRRWRRPAPAAPGPCCAPRRDLSRMLAASQLGITICSLLLGRLGEPAVAHLIEAPLEAVGMPAAFAAPDRVRGLAGDRRDRAHAARRDGAEEHRDRRTGAHGDPAGAAVPGFTTKIARPFIDLFNWMANATLRLMRRAAPDELEAAFTSGELADLIADSSREGLLDDDESSRLARTLSLGRGDRRRRRSCRGRRARHAARAPDRRTSRRGRRRDRLLPVPGPRPGGQAHRLPARQGHPRPRRRPRAP